MIERWRSARIAIRLDILATVILIVIVAQVGAFILMLTRSSGIEETTRARAVDNPVSVASPTPPSLSEPEKIARDWAEDNLDGVAGDELVKFISAKTNPMQPEMFRVYVKERLDLGTNWTYGPAVNVSDDLYNVTAMAIVRLGNIMPTVYTNNDERASPNAFRPKKVFTMPFHLTVDMESLSVTDWLVHAEEFTYDTNVVSVEDVFGPEMAECVNSALIAGVSGSIMELLLKPSNELEDTEIRQLNDALSKPELNGLCEEWITELPEK